MVGDVSNPPPLYPHFHLSYTDEAPQSSEEGSGYHSPSYLDPDSASIDGHRHDFRAPPPDLDIQNVEGILASHFSVPHSQAHTHPQAHHATSPAMPPYVSSMAYQDTGMHYQSYSARMYEPDRRYLPRTSHNGEYEDDSLHSPISSGPQSMYLPTPGRSGNMLPQQHTAHHKPLDIPRPLTIPSLLPHSSTSLSGHNHINNNDNNNNGRMLHRIDTETTRAAETLSGLQQDMNILSPLSGVSIGDNGPLSAGGMRVSTQQTESPIAGQQPRREPSLVVIACRQCRARKIRCDSTRPSCNNCTRRQNECQYDAVPKRRGPDKRPGTRQRSCKKRPSDGTTPAKKKPKKGSVSVTIPSSDSGLISSAGSGLLSPVSALSPTSVESMHMSHSGVKSEGADELDVHEMNSRSRNGINSPEDGLGLGELNRRLSPPGAPVTSDIRTTGSPTSGTSTVSGTRGNMSLRLDMNFVDRAPAPPSSSSTFGPGPGPNSGSGQLSSSHSSYPPPLSPSPSSHSRTHSHSTQSSSSVQSSSLHLLSPTNGSPTTTLPNMNMSLGMNMGMGMGHPMHHTYNTNIRSPDLRFTKSCLYLHQSNSKDDSSVNPPPSASLSDSEISGRAFSREADTNTYVNNQHTTTHTNHTQHTQQYNQNITHNQYIETRTWLQNHHNRTVRSFGDDDDDGCNGMTTKSWWDALLESYSPLREESENLVFSDLMSLFDDTIHWLSFLNKQYFFQRLQDASERERMQPSLVFSSLALATLLQSSDLGKGASGRERALWLRERAQAYLEAEMNKSLADPSLAQAAMLIAIFEASAHPSHSSERACDSLILLDHIIRSLALTVIDAADPDACAFAPNSVPSVPRPQEHDITLQDRCCCASPDSSATYASGSPPATSTNVSNNTSDNGPDLSHNYCAPLVHYPQLDMRQGGRVSPNWSPNLSWNPKWSIEEVEKEETRRLCWAALSLAAEHTAHCAAFHTEPLDLFLSRPENYALLFPGERNARLDGSQGTDQHAPPKQSVWALYCRSMLLWNSCLQLHRSASNSDRAEFALNAWMEAEDIALALDAHKCGMESHLMYMTREHVFNTQISVSFEFRRLQNVDTGSIPKFNRRQAEEWISYQMQTANRFEFDLHDKHDSLIRVLARRPFYVWWFLSQFAISMSMWVYDNTLIQALDLCKAFLKPLNVLSSLWPCEVQRNQYLSLWRELSEHCNRAGMSAPMFPDFSLPSPSNSF